MDNNRIQYRINHTNSIKGIKHVSSFKQIRQINLEPSNLNPSQITPKSMESQLNQIAQASQLKHSSRYVIHPSASSDHSSTSSSNAFSNNAHTAATTHQNHYRSSPFITHGLARGHENLKNISNSNNNSIPSNESSSGSENSGVLSKSVGNIINPSEQELNELTNLLNELSNFVSKV